MGERKGGIFVQVYLVPVDVSEIWYGEEAKHNNFFWPLHSRRRGHLKDR